MDFRKLFLTFKKISSTNKRQLFRSTQVIRALVVSRSQTLKLTVEGLDSIAAFIGYGLPRGHLTDM